MKIVDALKRLERAGSENSRATQKLHDAAEIVGDEIVKQVPKDVDLPQGYRVEKHGYTGSGGDFQGGWYLVASIRDMGPDYFINSGSGVWEWANRPAAVPAQTRDGSLMFARDVANGLLDEIAAWLEARKEESFNSAQYLKATALQKEAEKDL